MSRTLQKPPIWDLVGLVLVADKRLLYVMPALAVFMWAAGRCF